MGLEPSLTGVAACMATMMTHLVCLRYACARSKRLRGIASLNRRGRHRLFDLGACPLDYIGEVR
jgi:hypothetical protein